DGITWTSRSGGTTQNLWDITYGGGQYVAVGDSGTVLTSPDGITWTSRSGGTTQNLRGVVYDGDGGYRIAPALDLTPVGTAAASSISWTATTPAGTAVQVETSLDGGQTWDVATNGGSIPGITSGMDLDGVSLLVRQTLTTQDTTVTPVLETF